MSYGDSKAEIEDTRLMQQDIVDYIKCKDQSRVEKDKLESSDKKNSK